MAKLWAVSDLHISHRGNERIVDRIHPQSPEDWLIVAGDVAERVDDVVETLRALQVKFAKVVWVPGNHELYTTVRDPLQIFGQNRYDYYVQACRDMGIVTPEDHFPLWEGEGGPVRIVPMFLLYDYTFRPPGMSALAALAVARERNVVATDEFVLSSEPYATRDAWGRARVELTRMRLDALDHRVPTVLVNHWPLKVEACQALRYPEFSLWCGSRETDRWHERYNAVCCVYGHLHIQRTTWHDGVRFEEVSVGYPREWKTRGLPDPILRQILPAPGYTENSLGEFGVHFSMSTDAAAAVRAMYASIDRSAWNIEAPWDIEQVDADHVQRSSSVTAGRDRGCR